MSSATRERTTTAPPRSGLFLPPHPDVEEPYRVTPQMAIRIAILAVLAVGIFFALFFRLWALQVISGERYLEDARNNQVRTFRTEAPRGSILDRNGEVLVSNVAGTAVRIWPADLPAEGREQIVRRLSRLLDVPAGRMLKELRAHRSDPLTPVTVKTAPSEQEVNFLLEHQSEFPGVQIADVLLRRYERGVLASQLLGYVGEITEEQLASLEKEGYSAGDQIGLTGVEAAYDRYLRGKPGLGEVSVDAHGRVTGERRFRRLPEAGSNLRLTIDADLQATAEAALDGAVAQARANGEWASNGGAVVAMDPRNGEILALASKPTFDPTIYVGKVDPRDLKALADPAANYPTLNRAIDGVYPPGSTFKPVTALAAMAERVLSPGELIQCSPQMEVDGTVFRNWAYMNEPMTLTRALAASCDTYFYEVGLRFYRMPAEQGSPLQRWARRTGFGAYTGIDVGPEARGLLPTPAWRRETFEDPIDQLWKSGDSVQLAIGQKDMLVTPLQMTRFYALIANGGKLVQPHVAATVERAGGEGGSPQALRHLTPEPPKEIGLDPASLGLVREALYDAAHESYGTSTGVFGSFPVDVAGKTGTAEKVVDLPDYKGMLDQAWWCGFGPYDRPELVVCAVIENGGFGGVVAAPAARKVFEQYFGVEGGPLQSVRSD